jgi:hypothetical protein
VSKDSRTIPVVLGITTETTVALESIGRDA